MAKILVIEDDEAMAHMLEDILLKEKHIVDVCNLGEQGLFQASNYEYDILIVDWELPDTNGIDLIKTYRERSGMCPILMLTGRANANDKECGLDSGADDYLSKPFERKELTARIRALLRRPREIRSAVLSAGSLRMDTGQGRVFVNDQEIRLFPIEFALLEYFLRHQEQVFNVEDLLDRVWSSETDSTEGAVRTHIARLRKKLGKDAPAIETVYGIGYRLTLKQ